MNRSDWSESRKAWWRRGWTALITGVLLCPIASVTDCPDTAALTADGNQCHTAYVPLLGMILPLKYQVS